MIIKYFFYFSSSFAVQFSLSSHSQKSAAFRFEKSAKNVKIMGLKAEKQLFNLLNLSQKYRKMLHCRTGYSLNFLNSNL